MSESVDKKVADLAADPKSVDGATMELAMVKINGVTHVTIHDCDLALVMPAFGTSDEDFLIGLIHQVANAGSNSERADVPGVKFMLAFIKSRGPRDEHEAMLLALIAASEFAAMRFANRLAHAESLQEQDSAERTYNKLARTTAALVETFQRYRAGNEQKAAAQYVSVNDRSQTIAGNDNPAAQKTASKKRMQIMPALGDAPRAPRGVISELEPVPPPRTRR